MSTPCGVHEPIAPDSFKSRVYEWHRRVQGAEFLCQDFRAITDQIQPGDLIYCDPPYMDTQKIVYGAQDFSLQELYEHIAAWKKRAAHIALSIDGTKKSGRKIVDISPPDNLFKREVMVLNGRSMLRRFQRSGESLEDDVVQDRLLLTY